MFFSVWNSISDLGSEYSFVNDEMVYWLSLRKAFMRLASKLNLMGYLSDTLTQQSFVIQQFFLYR
jgi:hypothetical protein